MTPIDNLPADTYDQERVARQIVVAAASLSSLAQRADLEIVARLLNLVRIEAEIKLSQIKFSPPVADSPASSNPDERN